MEFNLARLVVDLIADPSQLNKTLAQVRKELDAWRKQVSGPIPIDEAKMVEGMRAAAGLGSALRQLMMQMGQMVGLSGVLHGSLGQIFSSLLLLGGATGVWGLAISAALVALTGLLALEYKVVKAFADWNDEIIRQIGLLDALGRQANAIDEIVTASRKLADVTRMNQDQARVLIMENQRVAKSFQDAADWAKVATALAARFNVEGPITPEKIARMNEGIFRMLEMAKEPGGMELIRGRMARQMGPEMRAELINVHTVEQLQRVLEKFAEQGSKVVAAEKTTFGFAWDRFVKDMMESFRIISEVVGPPFIGFLEGLMDAIHELWAQFRELLYALGVDKIREAVPVMREVFGAIFRFLFAEFSQIITVIGWLVRALVWLRGIFVSIVEAVPFIGKALASMLRLDRVHAGPGEAVNVPTIEGAAGKPEFSGLVEFWKKLQQSVVSQANDPTYWVRQSVEEQRRANEFLERIGENTQQRPLQRPAVAA